MNPKNHSHVIAAYLRLSQADGDLDSKTESNSISNQEQLVGICVLKNTGNWGGGMVTGMSILSLKKV